MGTYIRFTENFGSEGNSYFKTPSMKSAVRLNGVCAFPFDIFDLSEDEISRNVNLTQHIFNLVATEIKLTGFWDSTPAQLKLKAELQKMLLSPEFKDLPNITINTPLQKGFSCAIANIAIKDKKHEDLDTFLIEKYKIHVVSITWENIKGIRITPNVYTTLENLDRLVEGIRKFATS